MNQIYINNSHIYNSYSVSMIKKDDVTNALKNCYDPEIPVNIIDLGLVYDIKISDGKVHVKMTLTSPGCPMSGSIVDQVKQEVMKIKGVKEVDVDMVWEPPWGPDKMTEEAKAQLGLL